MHILVTAPVLTRPAGIHFAEVLQRVSELKKAGHRVYAPILALEGFTCGTAEILIRLALVPIRDIEILAVTHRAFSEVVIIGPVGTELKDLAENARQFQCWNPEKHQSARAA